MQIKTVRTSGTIPHTPVIEPLSIDQNGTYTAPTGVDGYSPITVNVAEKEPVFSGATIYDYDGTVIETYTLEEFAALTEYPTHPTHEYLTANGYNVALATAQAYAAKYGYVEVGAQYRVTDGKTRLFITLKDYNRDIQIGLCVNGSVDIDWGDGSEHGSITGSSVTVSKYLGHLYAQNGDYIITIVVTGVAAIGNEEDNSYHFIERINSSSTSGNAIIPYSSSLTKMLIGNNIRFSDSFAYYEHLETVLIPDNIVALEGGSTFVACHSLKSIIIPNGIINLPRGFIGFCISLTSVVIPYGPTSIPFNFASNCERLKRVIIPESVTTIETSAFRECYVLEKIIIPDSVTSIGDYAFSASFGLCEINIPDSVTTIGEDSLNNTSIVNLEIPENVTSIVRLGYSMVSLQTLKFKSSTPPTITGRNPWNNLPTDCIIYVPEGSLSVYTSASNYPNPVYYTYVEY